MTATTADLLDWSAADAAAFGTRPLRSRHRFADDALFSDEGLADLLDRFPRELLRVHTMGTDPARGDEWLDGHHADLSGRELIRAVKDGHLWFNLLRVHEADADINALFEQAYAELVAMCPGFDLHGWTSTLLISSPTAQVYYHADTQPNLLWHLRGRKRVYIYPALDPRYVDTPTMQRIFTGEVPEELPFDPSWDEAATVFDLEPGDVATWPQNAPHRVVNTDGLNVSVSTEHRTSDSVRRANVWGANRYFSHQLGLALNGTRETGPGATLKANAYRVMRKVTPRALPEQTYTPVFRVDPDAELGFRR